MHSEKRCVLSLDLKTADVECQMSSGSLFQTGSFGPVTDSRFCTTVVIFVSMAAKCGTSTVRLNNCFKLRNFFFLLVQISVFFQTFASLIEPFFTPVIYLLCTQCR